MMKHSLVIAGILLVISTVAFAAPGNNVATQTFTAKVAAISVLHSNGNPAAVEIVAPGTGGVVPADVTTTGSLAYTNVQALPAAFKIGAKIDVLPAGTFLKVVSAAPAAQFGAPGTAASEVTLTTTTSQPIVDAIGSCATGSAAGAALTYTFGVDTANMADLVPTTQSVTVTYTLSADGS
jgi:hypothetical protein